MITAIKYPRGLNARYDEMLPKNAWVVRDEDKAPEFVIAPTAELAVKAYANILHGRTLRK